MMGNTIDSNIHHTAGESAFSNVFDSVQMCCYYVLYYDFDFSTQQIKNLNKFLHEMNETVTPDDVSDIYMSMRKNLGIDAYELARSFPMRIAMCMCKKKFKNQSPEEIMRVEKNKKEAVALITIFMLETLRKHYKFTKVKLLDFWKKVVEFAKLYTNKEPLKDSHIIMYFQQECGLRIEMR